METYLRQAKGLKQKKFLLYDYIDGIKPRNIAWKFNYCERKIQQILKSIREEVFKNTS